MVEVACSDLELMMTDLIGREVGRFPGDDYREVECRKQEGGL